MCMKTSLIKSSKKSSEKFKKTKSRATRRKFLLSDNAQKFLSFRQSTPELVAMLKSSAKAGSSARSRLRLKGSSLSTIIGPSSSQVSRMFANMIHRRGAWCRLVAEEPIRRKQALNGTDDAPVCHRRDLPTTEHRAPEERVPQRSAGGKLGVV